MKSFDLSDERQGDIYLFNLKDVPEHLPQLAQWHHTEWTHLNPGFTLAERIEQMQAHLSAGGVPTTFVALKKTANTDEPMKLLGSASVIANDMDTKLELAPWLASVYVDLAERKQGIGATLVKKVMAFAHNLPVQTLYLFTPDQMHFYERLGWQVLESTQYRGEQVTVMSCSALA